MCREIAELDDEAQIVDDILVDKGGKGRIVDERREIVLVWQTQGSVHGVEPLYRELRTFPYAERTERGMIPMDFSASMHASANVAKFFSTLRKSKFVMRVLPSVWFLHSASMFLLC